MPTPARGAYLATLLLGLSCVGSWLVQAQSQPPTPVTPVLEQLASRVADALAKTHKQQVFIGKSPKCLFDAELCDQFLSVVRLAMQKVVPNVTFVERADILREIERAGFISDDIDDDGVLVLVSGQAGTEVLLMVDLEWEKGGYQLKTTMHDISQRKRINEMKANKLLSSSAITYRDEPLVYTNVSSGLSRLLVRNPKASSKVTYPQCLKCPEPPRSDEMKKTGVLGMVTVRVTITKQGLPVDIRAVGAFSADAADHTVKAIQMWLFKPAAAPDGTPLAMRTIIEMTYR